MSKEPKPFEPGDFVVVKDSAGIIVPQPREYAGHSFGAEYIWVRFCLPGRKWTTPWATNTNHQQLRRHPNPQKLRTAYVRQLVKEATSGQN